MPPATIAAARADDPSELISKMHLRADFVDLVGTAQEAAEKVLFETNCTLQGLKPNTF